MQNKDTLYCKRKLFEVNSKYCKIFKSNESGVQYLNSIQCLENDAFNSFSYFTNHTKGMTI